MRVAGHRDSYAVELHYQRAIGACIIVYNSRAEGEQIVWDAEWDGEQWQPRGGRIPSAFEYKRDAEVSVEVNNLLLGVRLEEYFALATQLPPHARIPR